MSSEVKFIDNSGKVLKEFNEKCLDFLELAGRTAEGYAKQDCPVDTGLLRNSITFALSGEKADISQYKADTPKEGKQSVETGSYSGTIGDKGQKTVYVGTNVKYAEKNEYGDMIEHTTGKAHFLRDSVTTHNEEYKKDAERIFKS